jgi:hypothetical protein
LDRGRRHPNPDAGLGASEDAGSDASFVHRGAHARAARLPAVEARGERRARRGIEADEHPQPRLAAFVEQALEILEATASLEHVAAVDRA